jgi:LPS-assembly protein
VLAFPNDPYRRGEVLVVGGRTLWKKLGFGARYEALLFPGRFQQPIPTRAKGAIGRLSLQDPAPAGPSPLAIQTIGLSYGPECDCWRLEGYLVLRDQQATPEGGFNLTLARFGTFGSGG